MSLIFKSVIFYLKCLITFFDAYRISNQLLFNLNHKTSSLTQLLNSFHSLAMSGPEYTSLPATDIDNISGDIFVPTAQEDSNTLDEPISATLVNLISP